MNIFIKVNGPTFGWKENPPETGRGKKIGGRFDGTSYISAPQHEPGWTRLAQGKKLYQRNGQSRKGGPVGTPEPSI